MPWLINAAQLDKFRKNQKNVIVLDATWHLPAEGLDAKEEFYHSHIAGARFFNLNEFHDQDTPISNMLIRDESRISELVGSYGITNDHKIIFYDNSKLHSSCRAAWMFKVFGHHSNQIYILDGGFEAWGKYGGKIESGEGRNVGAKTYTVNFQAHLVRTLMQMKTNLHHPKEQVVDMRHPVRYAGGPEQRMSMRSGHIPGSFSFPYMTMFETDHRWRSFDRIRKQLTGVGVGLEYPIISMCGSGMTAAILDFALDLMNHPDHALYDGSWAEWGSEHLYPGESGVTERPAIKSTDS